MEIRCAADATRYKASAPGVKAKMTQVEDAETP